VAVVCCLGRIGTISGAEPRPEVPLRVAVYDVAPYGWVGRDGLFSGLSVELWRRVAEDLHLTYQVTLVSQMDVILTGLERGEFDAAIGAITITPGRLARVDFTYPTHRSGVVVAFPKEAGPLAAVRSYGAGVKELGFLIVVILALLLLIGVLMWTFERPRRNATKFADSSVTTLNEGISTGRWSP
jgi:polar amino acid transport system substrate-binding protein